jgi:hypothetical protein
VFPVGFKTHLTKYGASNKAHLTVGSPSSYFRLAKIYILLFTVKGKDLQNKITLRIVDLEDFDSLKIA